MTTGSPTSPLKTGRPHAAALRRSDAVALAMLLIGAFMPPLDFFIVNLALPAIQAGLRASPGELQLVVSAYACAFAVFLVTGGRLGDLFGRKRLYMVGMAGFVLSSGLCAVASNGTMLVVWRVLQGLSAAVMVPQILATIRTVFPVEQQSRVMALYGFMVGMASVGGQVGGGALITLQPFGLGWPSMFLINIPVGLVALVGVWRLVPENKSATGARLDIAGVALLSLFLLLVMYPLTQAREAGWPAWMLMAFAASVPVLGLFLWTEARLSRAGRDPLLELQLFRKPVFSIGLALAFFFYCDSAFFMTYGIFLQSGLHWTPLESGMAILPFGIGAILGPLLSTALARRVGNHVLTAGFVLLAAGFGISSETLSHALAPSLPFHAGLLLAGTGHGTILPSITRVIIAQVETGKAGLASGVATSMLQIGAAFGAVAIGGAFFAELSHGTTPAAYAEAYQFGTRILSILFAACVALSLVLVRQQKKAQRG